MPVLGWFLVNLGGIVHFFLPNHLDSLGLFVIVPGAILSYSSLRRSMVVGMARLYCVGFAFELGAMMVGYPPMGQSLFPWMVMLALIVGIVGPIASLRARKNAYGVILATCWVLLAGASWEHLRAKEYGDFFAFLFFAGGLGWITHLYSRWVRSRALPEWITEWYWKLPGENPASLEALDVTSFPSSSNADNELGHAQASGRVVQFPEPAALEKEPDLDWVRVGK